MRSSSIIVSFLALAASSVMAAPLPAPIRNVARQALLFPVTPYASVQISGGVGGKAQAEAEAVCVAPFAGVALADVDATSLNNLAILRKAAEEAETDFNSAIDAASGAAAAALNVGKTKNKVLKLTCLRQVNLIKQAQGANTAAQIKDSETKLAGNISKDVAKAGAASTGIPNSPAAAASEKAGGK